MSLHEIRVYEDWQDRFEQSTREERAAWRSALLVVIVSSLFLFVLRVLPLQPYARQILAEGMVGALYLTFGAWAWLRLGRERLLHVVAGFVLILAGLLIAAYVITNGTLNEIREWTHLPLIAVALVLPGWAFSAWAIWTSRAFSLHRRTILDWLRDGIIGVSGGTVVAAVLFASKSLSGLALAPIDVAPGMPIVRLALYLGLLAMGQELALRGVVFGYLYWRRGLNFWGSTLVSLALGLLFHLLTRSPGSSPVTLVYYLLGPTLLTVVNCGLYLSSKNLVPSILSNFTYRVLVLLFALG